MARYFLCSLMLLVLGSALQSFAAITVHPLFDDNMVLQRNHPVNVWGKGSSGEKVTVNFGDKSVSTTVGSDGRWSVKLPSMVTSKTPQTLKINTIEFKDVLVGDVWILNGQSNMRWIWQSCPTTSQDEDYINRSDIRILKLPEVQAATGTLPEDKYYTLPNYSAHPWQKVDPAQSNTQKFSVMGLWFAATINRETDIPIGLILTAVGGTKLEAWTPIDALKGTVNGDWIIAFGKDPVHSYKAHDMAGVLYEYFTSGITPFTIGGYFWYQGEANSDPEICEYYGWNMQLFIDEMRKRFSNSAANFPFLTIQVHPWGTATTKLGQSNRAVVRDGQYQAYLAKSNTGLVTILDAAEGDNIHPKGKKIPGIRAGNQALVRWYDKNIAGGINPFFAGMSRVGDRVSISFAPNGTGLKTTDNQPPRSFIVRQNATDKWTRADAQIVGNTVEIWSSAVATINEVRYAWEDLPSVNLVNQYGQPVGQFTANTFGATATQRPGTPSLRAGASPAATQELFDIRGRRVQSSLTHSLPAATGVYIRPDGSRMVTAPQQ